MKNKFSIIGLITVATLLSGCSDQKPKIPQIESRYVPKVSLITLKPGLEQSFNITGDVTAFRSTQITAEQRGKVEGLLVKEGELVKSGQTLINLSSSDIDSVFRTAQSNLRSAQVQLESTKLSSGESVRAAEIALETAISNLQTTLRQNETSRKQAEETLRATETSLELKISAAQTEVSNAINNAKPTAQTAFSTANRIIGATDAYKFVDQDYRRLLGVSAFGSLSAAESALINVNNKLKFSIDTYSQALDLLTTTEDALQKTLVVLNNSATGEDYPQSQLTTDISSITPQLSTIRTSINALKTTQAALDSAKQENESGSQALIQAKASYEATLAQLETNETSARKAIESAENNLESAKRSAELSEAGAQSNLSNVYGQYDQARVSRNKLSIVAPFDGKIREILIESGEEINPGSPLITLEDDSQLKIIAYLSSSDVEKVHIGDQVLIQNYNESAPIHSISSSSDPVTKKYKVELSHQSNQIKPGALVSLMFESNGNSPLSNKIFIPLTSLHILPDELYVWSVEEGKTVKIPVQIGEVVGNFVEIKSGLKLGDQIIHTGGRLVEEEGVEVEVQ